MNDLLPLADAERPEPSLLAAALDAPPLDPPPPAGHRSSEDDLLKAMMSDEATKWKGSGGRGGGGFIGGRGDYGGGRGGGWGRGGRGGGAPQGTPPPGYVCFKCGIPGHFIQSCPSGPGERPAEVKLHRAPVGIPKSWLQAVADKEEGGLMLPDGTFAKMVPQVQQFEAATQKAPGAGMEVPPELRCPAQSCSRMFREPVRAALRPAAAPSRAACPRACVRARSTDET